MLYGVLNLITIMKNGSNNIPEEEQTFIDKFFALPWRKFLVVAALLAAGYLVSNLVVSCSTVRVVGNGGDSKVSVNQSALDSAQIVVEFKTPLSKNSKF